jgi:hypothetical protein
MVGDTTRISWELVYKISRSWVNVLIISHPTWAQHNTVSTGNCPSFPCATSISLLMLTVGPWDQFPRWHCSRINLSVCSVLRPYMGTTYTVSTGNCPSFPCATSSSLLMLTVGPRDQFPRWRRTRIRLSVCSVLRFLICDYSAAWVSCMVWKIHYSCVVRLF